MNEAELPDPHHVTVGYVGEPGARTFYVQAEDDHIRVTLQLEKQQVDGLADLLTRLLARRELAPATDWDRTAMTLREPVEAEWRIGEIGVGEAADASAFVLEFTEAGGLDDEPSVLRVVIDDDQARRLAAHAREQVLQGRPRCQLCGRPTASGGAHVCPSTNGHGELTR